jgi:outer membrane protein OmpA-like peptidoglycan-associated protein
VIRSLALLGMAASLAACSGEQGAAPNKNESSAADLPTASGVSSAPSPLSATVEPAAAPGSGLRGQVSALSGDVSGLDVRITDLGTVIDLPADALFEFDKAELTKAATVELGKAAELIRRGAPGPIQVIGHTDSKGDDAYNQRLSEERAGAVASWFGQQVGVRQRRFEVSGKGESMPVAPNQASDGKDDPNGRARNRRVEIIVPRSSKSATP